MARFIDADKVLQELGDAPLNWTDSDAEMQEQSDYKLFKSIIESQPTADVVEVKHGHWERVIPSKSAAKWSRAVSCSVCHNKGYERYNYCPNCGAKMDAEGGAE